MQSQQAVAASQTPAEQQKQNEEYDAVAKARSWYEKQNKMSTIIEGEDDDEDFDEEDEDEEHSASDY